MNKSTKITTTTVTSSVVNISKAVLMDIQLNVLSKGLKYVPTPSSLNVTDIITNSEKSLYNAPTIIKLAAIAEISTLVTKWKKPSHNNLTNEERKALKQIKSNPTITVVNAVKGGKMLVMNRDEYVSKIEGQLTNPNVYESVKDPTNSIKNKICKLTNILFKSGKISRFNKYNFTSIDNLPHVRGQPKIHKKDRPLRIITCTRPTILFSICEFTLKLIEQLRETIDNCVTNTIEFIDKIDEMQLEDNEYLASLDVIELFPNVSVNKATSTIIKRIGQSEAFCNSSLTKTDLRDLLNLCLQNNYFTFNNKFYRQTCGSPMGNILSPLLADLVMDEFMKTKLKKISKKLIRYVDDIFILTEMTETELKLFVDN